MPRVLAEHIGMVETMPQAEGVRVGKVVGIGKSGDIRVDYPGNPLGPLAARLTSSAKVKLSDRADSLDKEVLLIFQNNDPRLPVIVDTLYSVIDDLVSDTPVTLETNAPEDVIMDGRRMVFEAREEIILRCGQGSITLKKDGKVIIKGINLISRASEINKIRGGAVQIN